MTLTRPAIQLILAAAAALSLAACTEKGSFPPIDSTLPKPAAAAPAPMPTPVQSQKVATCAGDTILSYIGKPLSRLPTSGTWSTLRVIRPGDKVTSDFVGARLNAKVDGSGVITDLYCG